MFGPYIYIYILFRLCEVGVCTHCTGNFGTDKQTDICYMFYTSPLYIVYILNNRQWKGKGIFYTKSAKYTEKAKKKKRKRE